MHKTASALKRMSHHHPLSVQKRCEARLSAAVWVQNYLHQTRDDAAEIGAGCICNSLQGIDSGEFNKADTTAYQKLWYKAS